MDQSVASDNTDTTDVRWDVVFLLKNYPADYRLQGPDFLIVDLSKESAKAIAKATKNHPGADSFFFGTG
jgi:hypothetical protein